MRRLHAWTAVLALAALLAGCGTAPVGPDYRLPDEAAARRPAATAPFAELGAAGDAADAPFSGARLPPHWWRLYHDERQDALVQQALAHNTDLRQAVANLERVQALEAEVAGAARPALAVGGGPSYGHPSGLSLLQPGQVPPAETHYGASVALSYPVDWLGQLRRAQEAARAGSEAAGAALDLARVQVAAGTVRAYAEACTGGRRLQAAEQSVRLQQQALELTEALQRAGRVGTIDAARARSQLQQLQAAVPPLQAARQGALYRLATLTGRAPRDFPADLTGCSTPPHLAGAVPVGDGAALLRRRPDIRQAERELAAATARVGVAIADRYPRVTLGLSAQSAGALGGIGNADTFSWSLGSLISWTLPNTGVADARVAQAEAVTRQALARFDGVVLNALRETETTLNSYARELDRRAALQASRDEAAGVAGQARALYRGGKVGYLEALDAERMLAAAEAALAASEALLVDQQVQLFLALGGGWES